MKNILWLGWMRKKDPSTAQLAKESLNDFAEGEILCLEV